MAKTVGMGSQPKDARTAADLKKENKALKKENAELAAKVEQLEAAEQSESAATNQE